jgi:CheY-like chemotaxis protein
VTQPLSPAARTILILDDNHFVLKALTHVLSSKGYRVLTAESGADGIALLRHETPDLILLDLDFPPDTANVGVPLRDGFMIIDWARRMCHAEKIPVFIVSSSEPERYSDQARAMGITTFFKKPVDRQILLQTVHAIFADSPATPTDQTPPNRR